MLVGVLGVPADLKNLPMTHLYDWAVEIESYFESRLADDPGENSGGRGERLHQPAALVTGYLHFSECRKKATVCTTTHQK